MGKMYGPGFYGGTKMYEAYYYGGWKGHSVPDPDDKLWREAVADLDMELRSKVLTHVPLECTHSCWHCAGR